jgi:predicted metal-dependent hydrolase
MRRLPAHPLPASTFVAGLTARPPDGWFDDVDRAEWFDFGCDLFDAGCYFEAHELWEQCWRAARAVGNDDDARFLQGLIKLAAAGVKLLAGADAARQSHVAAAARLLAAEPRRGLSRSTIDGAIAALRDGRRPELP